MTLFAALHSPIDVTTGHGCWPPVGYLPPGPIAGTSGSSSNVIINGLFTHRVGDLTIPHFCNPLDIHPDVIINGDPTVLVNLSPIAIQGVSILAPAGLVSGQAATTVHVKSGARTAPTRL